MKKPLIIIVVVLLLVVALDIVSFQILNRSTELLLADLDELESACLQSQWKQAEDAYHAFYDHWDAHRVLLEILVDHSETDAISVLLERVKSQLILEDEAMLSDIAELHFLLEHLPDRFEINWMNLL